MNLLPKVHDAVWDEVINRDWTVTGRKKTSHTVQRTAVEVTDGTDEPGVRRFKVTSNRGGTTIVRVEEGRGIVHCPCIIFSRHMVLCAHVFTVLFDHILTDYLFRPSESADLIIQLTRSTRWTGEDLAPGKSLALVPPAQPKRGRPVPPPVQPVGGGRLAPPPAQPVGGDPPVPHAGARAGSRSGLKNSRTEARTTDTLGQAAPAAKRRSVPPAAAPEPVPTAGARPPQPGGAGAGAGVVGRPAAKSKRRDSLSCERPPRKRSDVGQPLEVPYWMLPKFKKGESKRGT